MATTIDQGVPGAQDDFTVVTTNGTQVVGTFVPDANQQNVVISPPQSGEPLVDVGVQVNPGVNSVTTFSASSINSVFSGSELNNQVFFDGDAVNAQVNTGAGNDRVEFNGALGGFVDLGDGTDKIRSQGQFKDVEANFGTGRDRLRALEDVRRSSIDAGEGDDTLVFGGDVRRADLFGGAGADTFTFRGTVRNTNIDLGGTDGGADVIDFRNQTAEQLQSAGIVISGADEGDKLVIGGDEYLYDSQSDGWVSGTDTLFFN
ncbi:MAG: hypothetical protein VKJ66_08540 [Synechococcus sp.]|nr:hypothetical protein [Synechococcus sp.]